MIVVIVTIVVVVATIVARVLSNGDNLGDLSIFEKVVIVGITVERWYRCCIRCIVIVIIIIVA